MSDLITDAMVEIAHAVINREIGAECPTPSECAACDAHQATAAILEAVAPQIAADALRKAADAARAMNSNPSHDRMERALRAVLNLHAPQPNTVSALSPHPLCECGLEWGDDGCPTVTTIQEALSDE